MVNIVGTIRAWHSGSGIYYYWATTDIQSPFVDYPISYPSSSTLSDFVLMDYFGLTSSQYLPEVLINWDPTVSDGYAVYVANDGADGYVDLCDANDFDKSKALGIASNRYNYIRTEGSFDCYCDSIAEPGDYLYLSTSNPGMVTSVAPMVSGKTVCKVGICKEFKLSADPDLISVLIQVSDPLYIDVGF